MDMEQLLLTKLAEECSEVIKLCMKAQQFGLDSINPDNGEVTRDMIYDELNDIMGVVMYLNLVCKFNYQLDEDAANRKIEKVREYAKHSHGLGRVNL